MKITEINTSPGMRAFIAEVGGESPGPTEWRFGDISGAFKDNDAAITGVPKGTSKIIEFTDEEFEKIRRPEAESTPFGSTITVAWGGRFRMYRLSSVKHGEHELLHATHISSGFIDRYTRREGV